MKSTWPTQLLRIVQLKPLNLRIFLVPSLVLNDLTHKKIPAIFFLLFDLTSFSSNQFQNCLLNFSRPLIFNQFYKSSILLTSSKNQIYEFRIPNIFCCLNENLTTFLYTLSLTEATRKQSVYISRMLLKKIVVDIGDSEFVNLVFR